MFWGRGQEDEGVIVDFEPYKLDGGTKKWLNCNRGFEDSTYDYYNINIGKDEYHTLAFLNRCANNVHIADLQMQNTIATGGRQDIPATGTDEKFYLYCGIGIENMEKLDFTNPDYYFSGTTFADGIIDGVTIGKYIVVTRDFTYNYSSHRYRFNVVNYCNQYDQSRLAYMNRFGAWDYITLNKERTDELKVKKEYITKPIINQATGLSSYSVAQINTAYPLDVAKQGMMTTSVAPQIKTKMFTDYLPEDKIEQIKDLMMSPQIHLLDGENAKALILENSSMKLKREKNRGLFKYELNFSFANPKYRTT